MKSKEYIYKIISDLVNRFPSTRVRYDYDYDTDTHSIEVTPSKFYHSNNDFNDWQIDQIIEFGNSYPKESICFLTDDTTFKIDTFQYETFGRNFYVKRPFSDVAIKNDVSPLTYAKWFSKIILARLDHEYTDWKNLQVQHDFVKIKSCKYQINSVNFYLQKSLFQPLDNVYYGYLPMHQIDSNINFVENDSYIDAA